MCLSKKVLVALMCLALNDIHAQDSGRQSLNIISSSSTLSIGYKATDKSIYKISINEDKMLNGAKAIELSFSLKWEASPPSVETDSIILKSINENCLLNNKLFDSIARVEKTVGNGLLFFNIIHLLKTQDVRFLSNEYVSDIILFIDKKPYDIKLSSNSQNRIKALSLTFLSKNL